MKNETCNIDHRIFMTKVIVNKAKNRQYKQMKNKYQLILPLLLFTLFAKAGEIDQYMLEYVHSRKSNFDLEKSLIEAFKTKKLIKELAPFYADTSEYVRQKAYYLTYKKGIHKEAKNKELAVRKLAEGCADKSSRIVGQNINYLKDFKKSQFDEQTKATLTALLTNKKQAHLKEIILLAGFADFGQEILYAQYKDPETPTAIKKQLALALARLGQKEALRSVEQQFNHHEINDQAVDYLVPMAIYVRQKETLNYCIKIIHSDKEQCHSPNPDYSGAILCGYRVMELLAPVINDFPIETDVTGSISNMNYKKALKTVRKWFEENPEYTISEESF